MSKIYQKTDTPGAKIILVITLSAGSIGILIGIALTAVLDENFIILTIACAVISSLALILLIFRIVYSRSSTQEKKKEKEMHIFSDEELQSKIKRKKNLRVIFLFLTLPFIVVAITLSIVGETAFYLLWLVPAIFPGIFSYIEIKQLQKLRLEEESRGIPK